MELGKYIDVYIQDVSGLSSIELRVYYADEDVAALGLEENSLRMYWWNGSAWLLCSNAGVNTSENYVWAIIGSNTSPSLSDLTGTPLGIAGRHAPPAGGIVIPLAGNQQYPVM